MSAINDPLDYEMKPKSKSKYCKIKVNPRWVRIAFRQTNYEDHRSTCELIGNEPMPKNMQGHISSAKLKGSPEYKKKVAKMTDRRQRIKTHNTTYYDFSCRENEDVQELRCKPPKHRIRDMPCPPLTNTLTWYPHMFNDMFLIVN